LKNHQYKDAKPLLEKTFTERTKGFEEQKNNKCPNCGANMNLNNNHFKCEYCGGIIKN
jgi:tRNA(Ile2) C34 agmatinyltransferase TiaS